MIFRIYPTKDTFISNARVRAVAKTGSNHGYAESLEVYKIAGVSGSISVSGSELSRTLIQFSTASLDSFLSLGYVPATRPKFYYIRLKHETTAETLPESFDVDIALVSSSWDEGRGMDTVEHRDSGHANWMKRTSTDYWTSPGGDFHASPRVSYHLDSGYEDIDSDITQLFNVWSSGTHQNNGLVVRLSASLESDSLFQNYYLKSFYSRHSQWPDRRPYVEVRWNDFVGDDRGRMAWGRSGSIFLYNIVDGQRTDLSVGTNTLVVRIADASGTLLAVTASHTGLTGVYSASFAFPTGSYSGSMFYDKWGSGSFSFMTGTLSFSTTGAQSFLPSRDYVARIVNMRDLYEPDEVVRFDTFFRRRSYRPSVVQTASLDTRPEIIERCFYSIQNDSTRESVVPFGTGSLEHTRLSYDYNGNYFWFPMACLHSGEVYRVLFIVEKDGQRQVLDNDIKFRVR